MSRRPRVNEPVSPTQRAEARALRREQYLNAAIAVISNEGPGASMEAIAHAAGVSKPILYRHFGDRDGLIGALADRLADELTAKLDAALSITDTPEQLARAAVAAYVETIEDDPGLYRYLTRRMPAGGAALSTLVDRVAAVIARMLSEGLRRVGRDTGSARPWSYGIVGMIHLAGDDWATHPGISREQFIDEICQLLWFGLNGAFPDAGATDLLSTLFRRSTSAPLQTEVSPNSGDTVDKSI